MFTLNALLVISIFLNGACFSHELVFASPLSCAGASKRLCQSNMGVLPAYLTGLSILQETFRAFLSNQYDGRQIPNNNPKRQYEGSPSTTREVRLSRSVISGSDQQQPGSSNKINSEDKGEDEPPEKRKHAHTHGKLCPLCNNEPCRYKKSQTTSPEAVEFDPLEASGAGAVVVPRNHPDFYTIAIDQVPENIFRHIDDFSSQRSFLTVIRRNKYLYKHFHHLEKLLFPATEYDTSKIKGHTGLDLLYYAPDEIASHGVPEEGGTGEFRYPLTSEQTYHIISFNRGNNQRYESAEPYYVHEDYHIFFVITENSDYAATSSISNGTPTVRAVGYLHSLQNHHGHEISHLTRHLKDADLLLANNWNSLITSLDEQTMKNLVTHLNVKKSKSKSLMDYIHEDKTAGLNLLTKILIHITNESLQKQKSPSHYREELNLQYSDLWKGSYQYSALTVKRSQTTIHWKGLSEFHLPCNANAYKRISENNVYTPADRFCFLLAITDEDCTWNSITAVGFGFLSTPLPNDQYADRPKATHLILAPNWDSLINNLTDDQIKTLITNLNTTRKKRNYLFHLYNKDQEAGRKLLLPALNNLMERIIFNACKTNPWRSFFVEAEPMSPYAYSDEELDSSSDSNPDSDADADADQDSDSDPDYDPDYDPDADPDQDSDSDPDPES
ncbi:hypothetical protein NX722_21275 [Endozoicomonas gorgoniicola]|uniref:Uncharacterized protein n=1 Tax=Endozoicomonas gorgoniicola TaxID=1234144 RepID=A0ABT3N0F5_9GAMM|nr:hypothetical protein [Endozoicomonas gorgoniicola]MCW7555108.1 hypothetical protein [Endozoicomonas gorgoniicola]